jgi:hypothetical protein
MGKPNIEAIKMTDTENKATESERQAHEPSLPTPIESSTWFLYGLYPYLVVAAFLVGILTSYVIWGRQAPVSTVQAQEQLQETPAGNSGSGDSLSELASLTEQVNPSAGFTLPVKYGDLGPRLIEAGVIDYEAFSDIYASGGQGLSQEQIQVLQSGSSAPVVITAENAHFLLNFFWAVGLANKNPVLTEGPIAQNSDGKIEQFASTGGWGLASKPVTEIYASLELITLTEEQQQKVEEVAAAVYRPCCNNPTLFPDCNHGMAMLGLLELMASQGASVEEMFTAAKHVNAFWFPQQSIETALYLKASQYVEFVDADARLVVGDGFSSGSGAAQVHQALQASGLLEQTPDGGSSCAN